MADSEADYQMVKKLGRGAFGEAALYRRLEDNSLVVWKEIVLTDCTERHRHHAMQEASLLSLLAHPNIIAYYNDFMDGSTLLIEMEYANGGTLHRKIYTGLSNDDRFAERWVLWMFYQIASAVNYIHERSIIHRDIKSLNIFLTKLGLCKLGDFGLARSLSGAEMLGIKSNVGTIAYMSPEIHKGETYNSCSDIWAVGCVLYEMAARSLPFVSTEIGRMAVEIVEGTPKGLDEMYSPELKTICLSMLEKDPAKRPTMAQVLASSPLNEVHKEFGQEVVKLDRSSSKGRKEAGLLTRESYPVVTSKSSEVFVWGGGRHVPQRMEALTKASSAIQVSAGIRHFAAVTVEKEVFTWAVTSDGGKMCGQLGHGDLAMYRSPRRIDSLCGQSILHVACGDDFTICLTDDGRLLAFGSNYWGCLGNGSEVETDQMEPTPTPVAFFNCEADATRVRRVAAGATFVFALTASGDVYSWGNGDMGQLGLGSEECFSTPQKVNLPPRASIRRIICGTDNTFLVTKSGRLLASGSNENNKSCLNQSVGPRRASLTTGVPAITTVHMQMEFHPVKALSRVRVVDVAAGQTHSAIIDEFGLVMTFGDNTYGQLGQGNFREQRGAKKIAGALLGKQVVHASCGDGFTMVATSDKYVFSWGRGDHGQLCGTPGGPSTSPHTSQRTGNALPRPVFSALHVVSGLCCKHWHGILIADKVLFKRTINKSDGVGSPVTESPTQSFERDDDDSVPSWLAEALEGPVIPMPKSSAQSVIVSQRASSPAVLGELARSVSQPTSDASTGSTAASPFYSSQRKSMSSYGGPATSTLAATGSRKHSPVYHTSSVPAAGQHRSGSPGRKAVLSVNQPSSSLSCSPVLSGVHHRRQSSTPATSPSAVSPSTSKGGSPGGRSKSPGRLHMPLARSSSAGRTNAVEPVEMTPMERLQQQVVELQKERDVWRREAEGLKADRRQLLVEIDVGKNKVADLQKTNQRLQAAHKTIEDLFVTWMNECNNINCFGTPAGRNTGSNASLGTVSRDSIAQQPATVEDSRSYGAPDFVRRPSQVGGHRRVTGPMKSADPVLGRQQTGPPGRRPSAPASSNLISASPRYGGSPRSSPQSSSPSRQSPIAGSPHRESAPAVPAKPPVKPKSPGSQRLQHRGSVR